MTADELFKKHWPPNVPREFWTDDHRYVAEVMFKIAWEHQADIESLYAAHVVSHTEELQRRDEKISKAIEVLMKENL